MAFFAGPAFERVQVSPPAGHGEIYRRFFCAEAKLIVELDGDSHAMREAYDDQRSRWLRAQGHFVARYWNHDVQRDLIAVLESMLRHCCDGSARD